MSIFQRTDGHGFQLLNLLHSILLIVENVTNKKKSSTTTAILQQRRRGTYHRRPNYHCSRVKSTCE